MEHYIKWIIAGIIAGIIASLTLAILGYELRFILGIFISINVLCGFIAYILKYKLGGEDS